MELLHLNCTTSSILTHLVYKSEISLSNISTHVFLLLNSLLEYKSNRTWRETKYSWIMIAGSVVKWSSRCNTCADTICITAWYVVIYYIDRYYRVKTWSAERIYHWYSQCQVCTCTSPLCLQPRLQEETRTEWTSVSGHIPSNSEQSTLHTQLQIRASKGKHLCPLNE